MGGGLRTGVFVCMYGNSESHECPSGLYWLVLLIARTTEVNSTLVCFNICFSG